MLESLEKAVKDKNKDAIDTLSKQLSEFYNQLLQKSQASANPQGNSEQSSESNANAEAHEADFKEVDE